jgi:HD-GYP domain-containing protein (c-di-GMP phosphodiesterase class II)
MFDSVLRAEPGTPETLDGEALDGAIRAMGEFSDMRSRFTRGHSAGVAFLAFQAAAKFGAPERVAIGHAAHLHDIGRAGIVLDIWDKPGPLTETEWERVRMHTYFTERILARLTSLGSASAIASLAHERLDGTGYHRRLPPSAVPEAARLLAAADAYHAMTESRPHRPALPPERAAESLHSDARAGRFDREAVDAVLLAAGQPVLPSQRRHAAGLTDREVAVLRLLARGSTNKEIAVALDISVKTVDNHVQHIFEKARVTTRAAAALFAVQHDMILIGP